MNFWEKLFRGGSILPRKMGNTPNLAQALRVATSPPSDWKREDIRYPGCEINIYHPPEWVREDNGNEINLIPTSGVASSLGMIPQFCLIVGKRAYKSEAQLFKENGKAINIAYGQHPNYRKIESKIVSLDGEDAMVTVVQYVKYGEPKTGLLTFHARRDLVCGFDAFGSPEQISDRFEELVQILKNLHITKC